MVQMRYNLSKIQQDKNKSDLKTINLFKHYEQLQMKVQDQNARKLKLINDKIDAKRKMVLYNQDKLMQQKVIIINNVYRT